MNHSGLKVEVEWAEKINGFLERKISIFPEISNFGKNVGEIRNLMRDSLLNCEKEFDLEPINTFIAISETRRKCLISLFIRKFDRESKDLSTIAEEILKRIPRILKNSAFQ